MHCNHNHGGRSGGGRRWRQVPRRRSASSVLLFLREWGREKAASGAWKECIQRPALPPDSDLWLANGHVQQSTIFLELSI
jgi:hypothetical protein